MARALISVSDKTYLDKLVAFLDALDVELVATGSSAEYIRALGISCTEVADTTRHPEILDGRVKTLHPRILGGILANLDMDNHHHDLHQHQIRPFDYVICNLYPFDEVFKKHDATHQELVENIDIGGVTLLRAAAKNHQFVTVICDVQDYDSFMGALKENLQTSLDFRTNMASKAFATVATYDVAIANYFQDLTQSKEHLLIAAKCKQQLRYGENSHQAGYYYQSNDTEPYSLSQSIIHGGKELSYNNLLDVEAAVMCIKDFNTQAVVAIKHNTPCGVGQGDNLLAALEDCIDVDCVSIFGGIVALNNTVDMAVAQKLHDIFLEVIIAPSYALDALQLLQTKKNLRIVEMPMQPLKSKWELRKIQGGYVCQDADLQKIEDETLTAQSHGDKLAIYRDDMIFAQKVCKYVKSNAIVFASAGKILGIGGGEVNRIDACKLALGRALANKNYQKDMPLVLASDAFFPFDDIVQYVKDYGIKAIIQPGGSMRDNEVIQACTDNDICLAFTGIRHFKH